jgi:tRNA (guanine37-N1)-methyltransferase
MKADVVYDAFKSIKNKKNAKTIYLSPQGKTLNQEKVIELSKEKHLILLCGHYEGIDERVLEEIVDEEISIGDYVLTGGELPAMVLIDSVSRYINGVINKESVNEESFSNGLLEYPQYTRPVEFEGVEVPEVLQSGHHENIRKWRLKESLKTTLNKRPDLLNNINLTDEERKILEELKNKSESYPL